MKRLFIVLTMALLLIPHAISAQEDKKGNSYTIVEETENDSIKIITTTVVEKEIVFTNGFWHNWEFTVGVGGHVYFGENDNKVKKFSERIAMPAFDFYITKWASPSFGVSIGITSGRFKGLYQSTLGEGGSWYVANFKTDDDYTKADSKWDYMHLKKQRGWFTEYYALAQIDVRSIIGGYNPDRLYSIDLYTGGGVMVGYDKGGKVRSGAFNFGAINKFRITEYIRFMFDVRGAVVADDFDGEIYIAEPDKNHRDENVKMDCTLGVTAGVSILLGKSKSKWIPARRTTEIVHRGDMAGRTDTIVVKEVEVVETVPQFWFHIVFDINKWDITNKEKVNLRAIADAIKSTKSVRYLVCGYADKQTATPSHNLMLSQKRSRAVFDFLVDECGVDPEMLQLDYKGGVDYMFYDEKELSRCVLITPIKE